MTSPSPDAKADSDLHIILALKQREPVAMAELYDKYGRIVYTLAARILGNAAEAEEVVQEVFLRVWTRAHLIDVSRSLAPWLLTVTRNQAIDYLRTTGGRNRWIEQTSCDSVSAAVAFRDFHNIDRLRALAQLTNQQRQVIEFAYFEGMSQKEISQRMDKPLGTVKSWTRTALDTLRKSLGQGRVGTHYK